MEEMIAPVGTVIKDSYLDNHKKALVSAITYILTEPGEVYTFSKLTSLNHIPEKFTIASESLEGKELKLMIGVVLHEMELRHMYSYNVPMDYQELKVFIKDILKKLEEDDRTKEWPDGPTEA